VPEECVPLASSSASNSSWRGASRSRANCSRREGPQHPPSFARDGRLFDRLSLLLLLRCS
jgi:hypothetical protein